MPITFDNFSQSSSDGSQYLEANMSVSPYPGTMIVIATVRKKMGPVFAFVNGKLADLQSQNEEVAMFQYEDPQTDSVHVQVFSGEPILKEMAASSYTGVKTALTEKKRNWWQKFREWWYSRFDQEEEE